MFGQFGPREEPWVRPAPAGALDQRIRRRHVFAVAEATVDFSGTSVRRGRLRSVGVVKFDDVFVLHDRASGRAQLSIRHGRRNYDRRIAGIGTSKARRYFASDFDRLSNRLFDASEIAAVEVVTGSVRQRDTARVQPTQQCNTGRRRNRRRRITCGSQNCFNWLKRNENALVLSFQSFVDPEIGCANPCCKVK